jgi:hypothetical protein
VSLLWPAFIPLSTAETVSSPATYFQTLDGSLGFTGDLSTAFVVNEVDLFGALNFEGELIAVFISGGAVGFICPIIPAASDDCQTVPFIAAECYPIPQNLDSYYYNDPITYNQVLFENRPLVYLKGPLPPKPGSPASFVYTES